MNFRSKRFHNFVESCLVKDYLIRGNCEQLLKHPFIRDCQEKQIKLQIKEYLDKTRKFRRYSNNSHPVVNPDIIQKQIQAKSDDDDDDDNDEDEQQQVIDEHLTQRENNLNTLRQNFKCVQHTNSSSFISILFSF
jgi:serine/threonine protein kinase